MNRFIYAHSRPWGQASFKAKVDSLEGEWTFVQTSDELRQAIELKPDKIFFVHWSQIIPADIVQRITCVNFHMTDLPFGRGGSPLQNLIVRGIKQTKLTAIQMDAGVDTGPVYWKHEMPLTGSAQEIFQRQTELSWRGIEHIISQNPEPIEQCGEVTVFKRRSPAQSEIPDGLSAEQTYDYIRMLDAEGYPHAFMKKDGKKIVFRNAAFIDKQLTATAFFGESDE